MLFLFFACSPNSFDVPTGTVNNPSNEWGLVSTSDSFEFTEEELFVFDDINLIRGNIGLEPLEPEPLIGALARYHSERMAFGDTALGHSGFQSRIASLYGEIEVISAAENVASNHSSEEAINAWLDSDGHADNILGDYNLSGVGISEDDDGQLYLTQIFVLGAVLSSSDD